MEMGDDDLHREHSRKWAESIVLGRETVNLDECPCTACSAEYKRKSKQSTYERALEISTQMTWEQIPSGMKHMISQNRGEEHREHGAHSYADNFNNGWD